MGYFITGATGFVGRNLVTELGKRAQTIWVLVRPGSRAKLERLVREWGDAGKLIVPVEGDLQQDLLGLSTRDLSQIRGQVTHFFHLGALYDLGARASDLERANVLGTRNALELAHEIQAGCFHLVSSIAVAGRYPGTFTEDMFAEATGLDHPYFRTKHESEALVRATCRVPWRVYRPGMIVGDSRSGAIDKIDGPAYLFKPIQKVRDNLPRWVPLVGFEGGHINLVPVDFVVAALVHLAHAPALDGQCFHLTDPQDWRIGEVVNLFAKAAHAPVMALRLKSSLLETLTHLAGPAGEALKPAQRIVERAVRDCGIPLAAVGLLNYPTTFGARRAQALLGPVGIRVPRLEDYAWRLWDYWERYLDPDLFKSRTLHEAVKDLTVLVTGGSSGIGRATSLQLAEAGAKVLVVGRDPVKLASVRTEIEARGGRVATYSCDLGDAQSCQHFIAQVLQEHGRVDILINNAGHSIRRAIENTYDRFHDYERLMRINYFAAVRVTLGLLPAMVRHGAGHVISISSIGVLTNAPRFAGYNASKAALEAFSRCAAAEYNERGIRFTVLNMPLVRTPMTAPTRIYEQFPLLRPEQAATIVCDAVVRKPERVAPPLGVTAQLLELVAPGISRAIMSESFAMFPESEVAGGAPVAAQASTEMVAFASLMRGLHW